jgi:spore coat protein U-like protein
MCEFFGFFSFLLIGDIFMNIRAILAGFVLASLSLAGSQTALAGTTTGAAPVTTSVVAACTLDYKVDAPLAYDRVNGAYRIGGAAFFCTQGTVYKVTLDQGLNAASGSTCAAPLRRARSAEGNYLTYTAQIGDSGGAVFGCDPATASSYTSPSATTSMVRASYFFFAAGQDTPAGVYADTVTMTVTF